MKNIFWVLILILFQQINGQNQYFYFESEAFANIKRIIKDENSLFILNNAEGLCLSKTSSTNGKIEDKIVLDGKGPYEISNPMDMDKFGDKIFIINKFGEYFIYNIKSESLSNKNKITYDPQMGNIYKVNFINSNSILISFYTFSTKKLNIKDKMVSHWGIFNINSRSFNPIWIPIEKIKGLREISDLNTWIFFTHGILKDKILLTFKGANYLAGFNLKTKKVELTLKVEHDGYFKPLKTTHRIYGKGVKTPATFVDKGMTFNGNLYFISGGVEQIDPQLIKIDSDFRVSIKKISLAKEFTGNISLNSTIYSKILYYWENWNLLPRPSFGFGIINLEF